MPAIKDDCVTFALDERQSRKGMTRDVIVSRGDECVAKTSLRWDKEGSLTWHVQQWVRTYRLDPDTVAAQMQELRIKVYSDADQVEAAGQNLCKFHDTWVGPEGYPEPVNFATVMELAQAWVKNACRRCGVLTTASSALAPARANPGMWGRAEWFESRKPPQWCPRTC